MGRIESPPGAVWTNGRYSDNDTVPTNEVVFDDELESEDEYLELDKELESSFSMHLSELGKFKFDRAANIEIAKGVVRGEIAAVVLNGLSQKGVLPHNHLEEASSKFNVSKRSMEDFMSVGTGIIRDAKELIIDVSEGKNLPGSFSKGLKTALEKEDARLKNKLSLLLESKTVIGLNTVELGNLEILKLYLEKSAMVVGAFKENNNPENTVNELTRELVDGVNAQNNLVINNGKLSVGIAKRYLGRGYEIEDLVQWGHMGLMKAALKFNPYAGNQFSTYATWWIRQAITRETFNNGSIIRLPVHARERMKYVFMVVEEFEGKGLQCGDRDLIAEVQKRADCGEAQAADLVRYYRNRNLISLNKSVSFYGEDRELIETIPSKDLDISESGIKMVGKGLMHDILSEVLSEKERRILDLRFGLSDGVTRTLEQVGQEYNVSRERIRQIESRAMRKLRHPLVAKKLEGFLP